MTGYVWEHEGRQFDPDGKANVDDAAEHNAKLTAAELAHWATKPDRMLVYHVGNEIQTFMGAVLGRVTDKRMLVNNLTGTLMLSLRIRGNNGADYYGRYGSDWSQAVRIRKVKGT